MKRTSRKFRRALPAVLQELEARTLLSYDVYGIQPAALDQPQVNAIIQRSPGGDPLLADFYGITTYNVQAYYDTGASGVLLSVQTADALGIQRQTYNGETVVYSDVGVGGSDTFNVSEPLYTSLGVYGDQIFDPNDPFGTGDPPLDSYTQSFGPINFQVGAVPEPTDPLLQGLDVFGMPVIAGKVMVMDPKPVNDMVDAFNNGTLAGGNMRTYIYDPGTAYNAATADTDPGIPAVDRHIALSYGSFDRFTSVTPDGAPGPSLYSNPFIGPNPVEQLMPNPPVDNTPPISLSFDGQTTTGSFLLDTGAAASMISQATAARIGVHYRAGTFGTDTPILEDANGNEIPDQFTLAVGGIGGTVQSAGFYVDELVIPTTEGDPVRLVQAPVLVSDITVMDPVTNDTLTLDGIFGMNYLVGSAYIVDNGTGIPDIGALNKTPFDWVVFDSVNQTLGLSIPDLNNNPNPTATLTSAPDVTAPGGTSYSLTVTYTGTNPVSVASIDNSDLLITAPDGSTITATPQTAGLVDSTSLDVTYTFTAPGGTWDAIDAGVYTIQVQADQVTDSNALSVASSELGTFAVSIPPTATLSSASKLTSAKNGAYTFSVTYTGGYGISTASLDTTDLLVTGPGGMRLIATPQTSGLSDAATLSVAYKVNPPGGAWDSTDSGTYTVSVQPNQVGDTVGQQVAPGRIGAFVVAIADSTPPRAVLPSMLVSPTTGKKDYYFSVTYTDDKAIRLSTLGTGDIRVTGPQGFASLASYYRRIAWSPKTVTVTYHLLAPGGRWDSSDSGYYLVYLMANQVSDTSGNYAPGRRLSYFYYSSPAPLAARSTASLPPNLFSSRKISSSVRQSAVAALLK